MNAGLAPEGIKAMRTDPEGQLTRQGETSDRFGDLTEALTALGNYLSAIKSLVVGGRSEQVLVETFEKALRQHERSVSAVVRLRASQPPSGDGWP